MIFKSLQDPHFLTCGHFFCLKPCILRAEGMTHVNCPICHNDSDVRQLVPDTVRAERVIALIKHQSPMPSIAPNEPPIPLSSRVFQTPQNPAYYESPSFLVQASFDSPNTNWMSTNRRNSSISTPEPRLSCTNCHAIVYETSKCSHCNLDICSSCQMRHCDLVGYFTS